MPPFDQLPFDADPAAVTPHTGPDALVAPVHDSRPDIEVRRSARRRRTSAARWEEGRIVVMVPASMTPRQEKETVDLLVGKLIRRRDRGESQRTDQWLAERADHLARTLLEPALGRRVRPASVRWSGSMNHRWGSCTVPTGEIRISDVLASAPEYVVDSVLVHELAHIAERNHSPAFRAMERLYPRHAEAQAWLAGWSAGRHEQAREW